MSIPDVAALIRAMLAGSIGEIDAVLLSHDQHSNNLDHSGKEFLGRAKRVARMSGAICGITANEYPRMSRRLSGRRLLSQGKASMGQ